MNLPLINIITRTSNRPNYFKNCYESVKNQTYKNINYIVGYDTEETYKYLSGLEINNIVKLKYISPTEIPILPGLPNPAPYNLYFNELLKYTKEGFVIYLDDDNKFLINNAIEIIVNTIKTEDDLILSRTKFPNKLIPDTQYWEMYKKGHGPIKCQIDTACFYHNTKYNKDAKWTEYSLGDYRCSLLLHKVIPNKRFIDQPLITLQRSVAGGHGRRDDLLK
jgi:glycosyltransferase involved in cell wall biosynthesis